MHAVISMVQFYSAISYAIGCVNAGFYYGIHDANIRKQPPNRGLF